MSARLPAWSELEIFLAAARGGTLAAAAKQLAIDASTVQRRIGKLESELDVRLFERSQRGYSLTTAGEELLQHVLVIESEVLAIGRQVGGRDHALQGVVRVSTVDDFAVDVLPPILRGLHERYPGLEVHVSVQTGHADLGRREADVAIRLGGKPSAPDDVLSHAVRLSAGFYASRKYVAKHGSPATYEDFRQHFLVRADESLVHAPTEQVFERHGDPSKVVYRSNSVLARLAAVREGLGISWLSGFSAKKHRSLVRVPVDSEPLEGDLCVIVHVDLRKNARVRAFVDFVNEYLVAHRDSLY